MWYEVAIAWCAEQLGQEERATVVTERVLIAVVIGVAASSCWTPVFECEPSPRWTSVAKPLDGSSRFHDVLGIADETVFTYETGEWPSVASIIGHSGVGSRPLLAVPAGTLRPSGAAVILGAQNEWVAIDERTMTRGRLDEPREPVVSDSPVLLRYAASPSDTSTPFDWPPLWAAMSEHTFHTSRDVLRLDDDYSGYKLVPIAAPIVRGATSPDERITCVTAEYQQGSADRPGRYGVHCFEWGAVPRIDRRPSRYRLGWSRVGELPESDAEFFDQPVAVVPLSASDLRYVSASRLELAPLSDFRDGEDTLDVTATRCGFWAHDGMRIFHSSGGSFELMPVSTRPVDWQVRNHVFGPQSAASLLDGVLTILTPHPASP